MKANQKNNSNAEHSAHMIEVNDLVHIYPNGIKALDNVSMVVGTHEKLAIVGQNGSGKTTLVKHFNALLKPTQGMLSVMGVNLTPKSKIKTSQLAKTIGYVFQNPNHQLFSVNVYQELCFGLKNLKVPPDEIKSKVQEVIEIFRLQPYLEAHPYSLSMGVRKLVAIASVYAMGPQLMVLDEPTTGQDYEGKNVLSQAIAKVYESGKSLVFVSHDMRFVAEHAERAVVMANARIIFEGKLQELFVRDDVLKEAQLRSPRITELGQRLVDFDIRPDVLTVPEMVAEIRRSKP
ncbi:MAG: energy-coupling factor ABC transporter ATP-binding protein [Anaerolineaceae bacterium]|nr:energy-coupling factor ABC transporter ATP-binding protein [Anaerolineaceae bacterium]